MKTVIKRRYTKGNGYGAHVPDRPNRDRLLFEVLRTIKDQKNSDAAKGCVSPTTIANWRKPVAKGGTRFPQAYTMDRVLRAHGRCLTVGELKG